VFGSGGADFQWSVHGRKMRSLLQEHNLKLRGTRGLRRCYPGARASAVAATLEDQAAQDCSPLHIHGSDIILPGPKPIRGSLSVWDCSGRGRPPPGARLSPQLRPGGEKRREGAHLRSPFSPPHPVHRASPVRSQNPILPMNLILILILLLISGSCPQCAKMVPVSCRSTPAPGFHLRVLPSQRQSVGVLPRIVSSVGLR
jgi:hypothetical protein